MITHCLITLAILTLHYRNWCSSTFPTLTLQCWHSQHSQHSITYTQGSLVPVKTWRQSQDRTECNPQTHIVSHPDHHNIIQHTNIVLMQTPYSAICPPTQTRGCALVEVGENTACQRLCALLHLVSIGHSLYLRYLLYLLTQSLNHM